MNVVLLSGGSGKRLWPMSNDVLSKQFIKLLKDDNGNMESMVQRVMKQLTKVVPTTNVYVSCNHEQVEILQQQLGKVETIPEPSRRNTFAAIALAAAYLYYNKSAGHNEVFVALPIDVYAEEAFFQLLLKVEELAANFNIGLLGAIPTYPSQKYGYIVHESGVVKSFAEKPALQLAEELLNKGALWNCGVAATKVGYVLEHARKYVQFDSFDSLYLQYESLPSISFDYEVIEKEKSIGVVVYDGAWKDLGTWNTFSDVMAENSLGNVVMSKNCQNTHTINMLDIPVVVQDISNAVVVASKDGILVTSKEGSAHLRELLDA